MNGDVCVCVSFFRLHRGEEGRVAASHSPELAGQDRHQEHEDALFAYAETNHQIYQSTLEIAVFPFQSWRPPFIRIVLALVGSQTVRKTESLSVCVALSLV